MTEQIIIFFQIVFIDLVLAGDNAIIIGMVASQFEQRQRKKIIVWGIGAAIILRIIFRFNNLPCFDKIINPFYFAKPS